MELTAKNKFNLLDKVFYFDEQTQKLKECKILEIKVNFTQKGNDIQYWIGDGDSDIGFAYKYENKLFETKEDFIKQL